MNADTFWKTAQKIASAKEFDQHAIELFHYQSEHVEVYKKFLELFKFNKSEVKNIFDIPFLPVQLFKSHKICDESQTDFYFTSSGTTGQTTSKHFVSDLKIYNESLLNGFKYFYGNPSEYCILALLPTYLEREHSSLVYMVEKLMKESNHPDSGFFLNNPNELNDRLIKLKNKNVKIFLLGVTYALLDLFEQFPLNLSNAIIVETGGMKGRRKEIIRTELHDTLKKFSSAHEIHSEYGMTELLSQAYSKKDGIFYCTPWMRVLVSEIHDPHSYILTGGTGNLNIIDLANIHSCAFIATQDLGRMKTGGGFEVLGRMDNSELRGCNLMVG